MVDIPMPEDSSVPERFNDTDRVFKIERLSGLIVESHPDKPDVGVLPDGTRMTRTQDETYKDFLDRCEAEIVDAPAI